MNVLVLHRVPDSFVHYAENIDHQQHDVTYVSAPDRLTTLPADVRAQRIERPGTGDTATEVLAAVAGLPKPGVVVALSEYDLLAAAQVRAALDVPGPIEADVLPTRDKVVMKTRVAAAGLRVPRFTPLAVALGGGPGSVAWTGRTILKPLARASSEGVRAFATVAETLATAHSDTELAGSVGEWEIEEFVEGPIIHVDGVLAAGEVVAVQTSRYVGTCLAYAEGRPLGSFQVETEPDVVAWTLECLAGVGVENGPFHLEAIESAAGLVFMEVGARFGGADVVDTFELATGVRMPSTQVRMFVDGPGERPPTRLPRPDKRYGWFVFPGHTLGSSYCRVSGEDRFRDDPLVRRWVQRKPDEPVSRAITYADTAVPVAGVVGPAPAPVLERFLNEMFESLRIEPLDEALLERKVS